MAKLREIQPTVILHGKSDEVLKQFDESGAEAGVMVSNYEAHEIASDVHHFLREELQKAGRDDVICYLNSCVVLRKKAKT